MDELYLAWNKAFEGYVRTWTKPELRHMLQRRGYVPDVSFGAFINEELVSFTLNAVGMFNGELTAYDTGTATIEDFRGQGFASRIFRRVLPLFGEAGISQYLLEVIQSNTGALTVYKNLGFRITRELDYFIQETGALNIQPVAPPKDVTIRATDLSRVSLMESMTDFTPSWQNSFEAILRVAQNFKIAGAFYDGIMIGYGIIDPSSGDIPQLAVIPEFRRRKIGSALLAWLLRHNLAPVVRIINIESSCKPVLAFLASAGIGKQGSQYEMLLDI